MPPSEPSPGVGALLDDLPATLDALLAHPERHRPAVVERLLELTDELRRADPRGALALAEAAQRLAAKIPAFFPRDERFRLRARSFEVWGGETVGELVTLADLVEDTDEDGRERTAVEVILRREAPAWGGLPWKISALIRLYSQRECDVALIHEVPSASAPGGWAVQDKIGWKVFDSDPYPDPEP